MSSDSSEVDKFTKKKDKILSKIKEVKNKYYEKGSENKYQLKLKKIYKTSKSDIKDKKSLKKFKESLNKIKEKVKKNCEKKVSSNNEKT